MLLILILVLNVVFVIYIVFMIVFVVFVQINCIVGDFVGNVVCIVVVVCEVYQVGVCILFMFELLFMGYLFEDLLLCLVFIDVSVCVFDVFIVELVVFLGLYVLIGYL